jgi:predicted helicase
MTKEYLKRIIKTIERGDAREESFYPALSDLLLEYAQEKGKTRTQVTTLPKKTEAGNPDFRVWDGTQNIVGYIEAKKPGESLDLIEESGQLKRYRKTFPNLILTDFFEFRLYRNGERIDKTFIARSALAKKGVAPPVENEEKFFALLEKFFGFSLPQVRTAVELARELAKRTRFLRDEVIAVEIEQQQQGKGELYGFFETFRKYLIANLKEDEFADLFSQTITYGLFAARTRSSNGFNRKLAYDLIPKTIGILRNVFRFVSQGDLPKNMEVMIDDIAEVLNAADARNILHQYYKAGKGEDPVVHFYETFLGEYDPATREKRGVYYTPEPVVRYIVRSVHEILKTRFDLADGLANKEVTLLDPAAGTLTFPAEAIKLAVKEYAGKYGEGGVRQLISEHILPHFHAFELMMAPYAIGHIKISFLLEELGYNMKEDERFRLYLTNTLDMEDLQQTHIPGLDSLSEESHEAGRVKKSEPILVIMGNPPYSANSANYNDWTEKLMKEDLNGALSYYKVDGEKLKERNSKLLQDDYVKFLRFAQWKVQTAGKGIVAMITNHGYLENVTFPGMRQSLMKTFNEIFILNLHGDSQKKEKAPDGGKDENVFDITKGTTISIFIKESTRGGCSIFYKDLYGLRETKYKWLDTKTFKKKDYELLKPEQPWFFYVKRNTQNIGYYSHWLSLTNIFPINSTGIKTHRDDFVISFKASDLENRIRQFKDMLFSEEFLIKAYGLENTTSFNIQNARTKIASDIILYEKIQQILYRPFDSRFIIYSDDVIDRPRREVMKHLLRENLALGIGRQGYVVGDSFLWNLVIISDKILDVNLFYRGGVNVFPLYLYKPTEPKKKRGFHGTMMLFDPEEEYGADGKKPNIAPKVFDMLEAAYRQKPAPEQILYYCYAVLYSPAYREKYAEFLKIDFPRIPFTADHSLFLQMAEKGEELAQLHLLKSKKLNRPLARYWGSGEDLIEKPVYNEKDQCVFINKTKHFQGITLEVWEYHIGGYQVMEKYLKDRKGRQMTDPATYCKIATALAETIRIQQQLDELFTRAEEKTLP